MEQTNRQTLVEQVTQQTHTMLTVIISDEYINDILQNIIPDIIHTIETSDTFQTEGYWNINHVRDAIGRILTERLNINK